MKSIFGQIASWIIKYFISFLLILGVLMAGNYLKNEYHRLESIKGEIAVLKDGIPEIQTYLVTKKNEVFKSVSVVDRFAKERIDAQINALNFEISKKTSIRNNYAGYFTSPISKGFVDRYKLDIEIELLNQEREYMQQLRSIAQAHIDLEAGKIELERRRQVLNAVVAQHQQKLLEYDNEFRNSITIPGPGNNYASPFNWKTLGRMENDLKGLVKLSQRSRKEYDDQNNILELRKSAISRLEETYRYFQISESNINKIIEPLHIKIREQESNVLNHWLTKIQNPSISTFQTALIILIGAILTPIAIKFLFYFVFAPLAARRPPICIIPSTSHPEDCLIEDTFITESRDSAVSRKIIVDADHELLLHPEYLQSSSVHGKADTKYLLNWSCPLSSLASGLVGLTRIQSDRSETVVVSSTKDPFSEVAMISLADGDAMVFQPRSLVGVLYPKGHPVRITRHWRIWSSHAWLTLQLRYLVFHGPASLIVRGCRGVRVENAGNGRRINQASTMGFSANLRYSTTRTETFMPYFFGKQELFIDSFEGNHGVYVYEEMPNYGKKSGITGRGLEGITDSFLKVFGI